MMTEYFEHSFEPVDKWRENLLPYSNIAPIQSRSISRIYKCQRVGARLCHSKTSQNVCEVSQGDTNG